jgi:hypothetical protein
MKSVAAILMVVSVLASGCGVSSHFADRQTTAARERWILTLDRQFLPLRQEAIVVPEPFKSAADEVEREVSLDGYITGYDWVVSASFFHGTPVTPPRAIVDDPRLTGVWTQAYEAGCSNGLARMDAFFGENPDKTGGPAVGSAQ